MNARILVVAAEASGDEHAARLVAELKQRAPHLTFFGMGGSALAAQQMDRLFDAKEISVMGFVEVLPKLSRILHILRMLTEAAAQQKPALAILIDAPDFNLRLAARLKALGIRVIYYVSPMVWAWRSGRTTQMARVIDELLCILPFEETFLKARGVNACYVGSPVLDGLPTPDSVNSFRESLKLPLAVPVLALLPGSRHSEIDRLLPTFVDAAVLQKQIRPSLHCVVPIAPGLEARPIEAAFAAAGLSATFVKGQAAACVGASDVALVASGTACLEAALMQRPLVVAYRLSTVSHALGRAFVRLPYFSLVNLLLQAPAVPELLQQQATGVAIHHALLPLWQGPARERQLEQLSELRRILGPPGASARAAERVLHHLKPA
jgi:lipid-A-disaccharide synthase